MVKYELFALSFNNSVSFEFYTKLRKIVFLFPIYARRLLDTLDYTFTNSHTNKHHTYKLNIIKKNMFIFSQNIRFEL